MSHIVTVTTQVRDPVAVEAACRRLGLAMPVPRTAQLYSGEATGLLLQLPNWLYPLVLDLSTGTMHYDNYGGAWGDQVHLDKFLQMYAVEKTRLAARSKGYAITEQALDDGSIRLAIQEGG